MPRQALFGSRQGQVRGPAARWLCTQPRVDRARKQRLLWKGMPALASCQPVTGDKGAEYKWGMLEGGRQRDVAMETKAAQPAGKGGGGGEREEPPLLTPFGLNSIRKPQRNAAWLLSLQEGPFHAQQKPTSGEQARGPCLLVSMVVRFLEAAGWKEDARFEGPRLLYYSKLNALGLREAYARVNMPKMMALQHKPMHTVLTQKYVPLSSRDFTH